MTLSAKSRIALKRAMYTAPGAAKEICDAIDGYVPAQFARFATTANINTATTALTAIDDVTPVANDVVLVKNQSTASQNGLYVASATAWLRLKDGSGANIALKQAMTVAVSEGTANANTEWMVGADLTTWTEQAIGTGTPAAVGAAGTAGTSKFFAPFDHVHADPLRAVAGTGIADSSVTIAVAQGQWRKLPAATLSTARSTELSMTGASAGVEMLLTRLDVSDNTWTITDAGPGTPTLFVFPGGAVGAVRFQSDGTNWFVKEQGVKHAVASATIPGTQSAAHFLLTAALNPVFKARAAVFANVASIAAFVVSQDGVTLVQNDVVLLANQTTPAECGLYVVGVVAGTAPLTRIAALPTAATYVNGMTVEVSEGTLFAGSTWKAMCTGAKVVGTDDPLFYPRTCRGILTLASGTKTLGATEGLFLFSVTRSTFKAGYNTAGGTVTSTVDWRAASASRVAGKSGTAAVVVIATVAAGTIDSANNSTMDWEATNW